MPNNSKKDNLGRFNVDFLSARTGEWIYVVALNWIVLTQSSSPWLLAVVNACRLAPALLLSVPAGHLADRRDPKKLSFYNNLMNGAVMLAVGLALHLECSMLAVNALVLCQAVITALEGPFRNTTMNGLFEGQRLKAAVAQNASVMNLGRIIGPILAGYLLAKGGGMLAFGVAALFTMLFSAVLSTLEFAPRRALSGNSQKASRSFSLWSTLRQDKALRDILLLAAPMMFFGFPYTAMLSVLTDTLLHLGSEQLGALTAISAAGALAASSFLGLKPEIATWRHTLKYALMFALSLMLLAGVQGFVTAAVALFLVGYLGQAYRSCSRMHLHDVLPKEGAGRVLGLSLMDRGMIPLGGLMLGAITEFSTPRVSYAVMGLGCLVSVAIFYRSSLRTSTE